VTSNNGASRMPPGNPFETLTAEFVLHVLIDA
jgi:hypothetical protein